MLLQMLDEGQMVVLESIEDPAMRSRLESALDVLGLGRRHHCPLPALSFPFIKLCIIHGGETWANYVVSDEVMHAFQGTPPHMA